MLTILRIATILPNLISNFIPRSSRFIIRCEIMVLSSSWTINERFITQRMKFMVSSGRVVERNLNLSYAQEKLQLAEKH